MTPAILEEGVVTVVGLSKSGLASALRLAAQGRDVVLIEELIRKEELGPELAEAVARLDAAGVETRFGDGNPGSGIGQLPSAGSVVLSPGVREAAPLIEAAGEARLLSEPELAFRMLEARRADGESIELVGVTGTNGKTTVTSMLTKVASDCGRDAIACGNIGHPLVDAVSEAEGGSLLVAELSSFQLRFSPRLRPDIAILLNFAPDHLDWHPTLDAYADAKGQIFAHQQAGDFAIWNADDNAASEIAERWLTPVAEVIEFTCGEPALGAVGVAGGEILDSAGLPLMKVEDLQLRGEHNLSNALAVVAAAQALALEPSEVANSLAGFEAMKHRMEVVASADGITFVDDSKATNPHAAVSALGAFDSVILIAGGQNKGLDLSAMAAGAAGGRPRAVVAIGEASAEIVTAFAPTGIPVIEAASMGEAVIEATRLARAGDVVLLSPGCASFDAYSNYQARGDDFAAEVMKRVGRGAG